MPYVPPSGLLGVVNHKKVSAFNKRFVNTPLRMGVVVKCYEKTDEENVTKLVPEYDVITGELNQKAGQSYTKYLNCITTDSFGGLADFFEYKLRPSEIDFEETYDLKKQNGSMVLLLCLDGFSESGIIIGGIKNIAADDEGTLVKDTNLTKENEIHLEGEYNGLNWQVNKDGEFTLTFKTKTDIDGKPLDEKIGGTFAKFDKTGSVEIDTKLEGDEATSFKIDKTAKDINSIAGNDITSTAKNDIKLTAEKDIKGTAKGKIELTAEGSAKFTSKSMIDIEGKSAVNIKAANIQIQAQNGILMTGSQILIDSPAVIIGQGATPALINTTLFTGPSPFFGIPVFVTAIGPFSSSVAIGV